MLKIADEPRMMTNMLQFLLLVSWRRGGKLTVGIADSELLVVESDCILIYIDLTHVISALYAIYGVSSVFYLVRLLLSVLCNSG